MEIIYSSHYHALQEQLYRMAGQALRENRPTLILVPAQASFLVESGILRECGVQGFLELEVMSFEKLTSRMLELEGGRVLPALDGAGVAMLATGITFAVLFGITAIACFGTAGMFTSGSAAGAADMTVLGAIGEFAMSATRATGWCSAAVTAVFGWLTAAGASRMKAAKTLELYADTAEGFDWHKGLSLSMLAELTHKKKAKALRLLRKFIHKGWLSAWMDEKNDKLYLTAEDYRTAQENQPEPEPEKAPEQAEDVPLNLETTRRFAQVLEKETSLMEDERAVEELQHMQKTTESIGAWLEAHPESLPKARRFAEYYIPTTLKLLHTYNDVQGQQGENAEAIRRDIAGILHTLNQAYDNLYDKLLSDMALDVSSEIAALQGMLANDGLAGEEMR